MGELICLQKNKPTGSLAAMQDHPVGLLYIFELSLWIASVVDSKLKDPVTLRVTGLSSV